MPPSAPPDAEDSSPSVDGEATVVPGAQRMGDSIYTELDAMAVSRSGPRYSLRGGLGVGGTSRVMSALDNDLGREVAIKLFRQVPGDHLTSADFVEEAQVTSSLEHPNIAPVYDLGRTTSGGLYLTMRRVRGHSLGQLLRETIDAGRKRAMPLNDLLSLVLKTCDALSYAHDKGVIHQDVKPDNIMVGRFGEVMLVDWGAASSGRPTAGRQVTGTPLYMSPEQARGEAPHPSQDVFSLAVTLFYALFLRHPLRDADPEQFWVKRLAGVIDWPTAEELVGIPPALVQVLKRALAPASEQRYTGIASFAKDVRAVQAGDAMWFLHHDEEFAVGWERRWYMEPASAFAVEDGALVSQSPLYAFCVFRSRLPACVALELDGEVQVGAQPGDVSVVWIPDDLFAGEKPASVAHTDRYGLQVGAYSKPEGAIYFHDRPIVAARLDEWQPGKRYRIRAEVDGKALRLFVDGRLICEHMSMFPHTTGHLALYAFYPGKRFSAVRILSKGLPEAVSPLAIGDSYYQNELFVEAATQYGRVAATHGANLLGEEARFKHGLALMRAEQSTVARRVWSGLSSKYFQRRVQLYDLPALVASGIHDEACQQLVSIFESEPALRNEVRDAWADAVLKLTTTDAFSLHHYLGALGSGLGADVLTRDAAARALVATLQFERAIAVYPDELCIELALGALGREAEIETRFSQQSLTVAWSRFMRGLTDHLTAEAPLQALAELMDGNAEPAFRSPMLVAEAMLFSGDGQALLDSPETDYQRRGAALCLVGRSEEAAELGYGPAFHRLGRHAEAFARAKTYQERHDARLHLMLEAYIGGEMAAYESYVAQISQERWSYRWDNAWFAHFVLMPFLEQQRGKVGAVLLSLQGAAEHRERFAGRFFFAAQYVTGKISKEVFQAQPTRFGMPGLLALCDALRHELEGQPTLALARYREFQALPPTARMFDWFHGNPLAERFARWRADQLFIALGNTPDRER